jgi:hypothetical protein
MARAEDVPRIRELTGKWREAEKREKELQDRLAKLESRVSPSAPEPLKVLVAPPPPAPKPYEAREPQLEDFADSPDPYLALTRAAARYDREKEAYEAKTASHGQTVNQSEQQRQQARQQIEQDFGRRMKEFIARTPDYHATQSALQDDRPVSAVGMMAIQAAANGPEIVYHLLKHPALADEFHFLTDGKPVTGESVAMAQRWLAARVQAVAPQSAPGSAAAVSRFPAPKPPNPVRTGTTKTSEDAPADDHSISAHRKHWGRR